MAAQSGVPMGSRSAGHQVLMLFAYLCNCHSLPFSAIPKVKPNCWRLVLEVSFLGASCDVEVDERMVERICEGQATQRNS